ncbi:MAG TPA: phytoene desaturase family protein [Blastocatellia bacterium]|nr:phytoene desaturase family protein [Blastocatellia bacterium]
MKSKHAVIIGGGLGGLAVALRLAARNWSVTVCEQGAGFGGKMNLWSERGFRFDTGPSLITMPWVFADLFAAAGAAIEDHLEIVPVHPISEYIYPDGAQFTYSASMPEWLETVRNLDARDVDGFLRFMNLGARLYEISKDTFLRHRPLDWPRASSLKPLRHLPCRYGWGNYHKTVIANFRSPHLRQLYDRYPTYVGSSPYRSPATLAVIPFIEYAFGAWYVKGGLYRIVESLVELARERGVQMLLDSFVQKIECDGKKALGVRQSDNGLIEADVVVMNGDQSYASEMIKGNISRMENLISPIGLPNHERSMSGFVMLLGIKRTMPELRHHAIYFSADYENEFSELFEERVFPTDPTVYVNVPSRSDRSVTPGEGETIFIMANAPANDHDNWNEEQIGEARRRIFARLRASGFPEIENDIVASDIWTPKKIGSRYLMPGGAIYGRHSHGWKNAFLRPPNKDRNFDRLYYVGGSTHPGGGTPTVLLSAQITSELIERYERY